MTCDTFAPLIALHIEGDLPAAQVPAALAHLAACARCRHLAEALQDSQRSLKDLARQDLDPKALAAVRARVRESLDRRAHHRAAAWALAAAATLAVITSFLLRAKPPAAVAPTVTQAPTGFTPAPAVAATALPAPARLARSTVPEAAVRRPAGPPRRATLTLEPPLPQAPGPVEGEPLPPPVLKLVTSDPDVVIYWVTEPDGGQS